MAKEHAEKLEPRLSRIKMLVPADVKVDGLVVRVDGFDGGLDNVGAQLIEQIAFGQLNAADNVNSRIRNGRQSLLLVISQYNGKANDREVKLGFVPSDGIRDIDAGPPPLCPGSVRDPNGGHWSPTWCGTDPWSIVEGTAIRSNDSPVGFPRRPPAADT